MKRVIPLLAAALAALLAAPRALGDYTPVEWIKASGSQWIFTGYTPAVDDRVEMKAMLAADNATQTFWCSRGTTTTTNTFTAFFVYDNGKAYNRKVRFDYGGRSPASDFSSVRRRSSFSSLSALAVAVSTAAFPTLSASASLPRKYTAMQPRC